MIASKPCAEAQYAVAIKPTTVMPVQKAPKLPATKPDKIFNEAPPSREAVTISFTWRECELVNTLVNSGIKAPAKVPHEIIKDSFHQMPSGKKPIIEKETAKVTPIEISEVSHTKLVNGASKLNF